MSRRPMGDSRGDPSVRSRGLKAIHPGQGVACVVYLAQCPSCNSRFTSPSITLHAALILNCLAPRMSSWRSFFFLKLWCCSGRTPEFRCESLSCRKLLTDNVHPLFPVYGLHTSCSTRKPRSTYEGSYSLCRAAFDTRACWTLLTHPIICGPRMIARIARVWWWTKRLRRARARSLT